MPLGYIVIITVSRRDITMIIESSKQIPAEMKTRLSRVVLEDKISSIETISQLTGMEEEEARIALQELVSEGSLEGKFSDDGSRFYLSDVKVSDAPIMAPADTGPEIIVKDTKASKTVALAGFILIIAGYILRGFTIMGESMQNIGFGIIMIGLAVLIVGVSLFSRLNPPTSNSPLA
ncbi:MAG: hypothetical protein ACFFF9_11965 [Candidatus Thorarchaeota archaeon]